MRSGPNTLPFPDGWTQMNEASGYKQNDTSTGFMAGVYVKGNEVVISYWGTTDENSLDWTLGNLPAGIGLPDTTDLGKPVVATQVVQAAKLYMKVSATRNLPASQFHSPGIRWAGAWPR